MKPINAENHFPWYIDSSDTDNIDCQCGHPCDGIAGWADHITKETEMDFVSTAQKFIECWDDTMLSDSVAQQLRCEEVEALADMLRALGATAAAARWIDAHAVGDECEDMHCRCVTCGVLA